MNSEVNSKRLVRDVFESRETQQIPFIPWVFTHAARLEQISIRRMYSDPSQYVKCLQNTQKLYRYDAIVSNFDSSLEAEICGCAVTWGNELECPAVSPVSTSDFGKISDIGPEAFENSNRFRTVVESYRRINMVSGSNTAMVAAVTGPLALTASVLGENLVQSLTEYPEKAKKNIEVATRFLLKEVQIYCQLEPDIITIADDLIPLLPVEHLSWLHSVLSPVLNTIRFYNAFSVILPGKTNADTATLIDLGFDGIVASDIDVHIWDEIRGGRNCILGQAIPSNILNAGKAELQNYLDSRIFNKTGLSNFITTDWEVPAETPPDNMHLLVQMISRGL
ncbi:uroporphyrinogen decarboxylase family protein [Chloroflexota bacterium]